MRLIDADALMRSMKSALDSENPSMWSGASDAKTGFRFAMDFVCTAPTISPDEVRGVGEWITDRTWEHDGEPYCSVCDFEQSFARFQKFKFCPNCGVRMKGAEDGTTD